MSQSGVLLPANRLRSLIILTVIGLVTCGILGAQQVSIPDPSTGVVDGMGAVGFWVTDSVAEGASLLDTTGYSVHLVPHEDLDHEFIYPCGEWFVPSPGRYSVIVEGPGMMTPFLTYISYHPQQFKNRGRAAVALVVPAGTVVIPESVELGPGKVVRLLHLNSHLVHSGYMQREMSRRALADAARRGVMMPAGPIVAGIFDNSSQEYLALSKPIDVPVDGRVEVRPQPPSPGTSHLLTILQRPERVAELTSDVGVFWARAESGPRRAADVLIPAHSRVYAIWYGLSGKGHPEVDSSHVYVKPRMIALEPGRVHRLILQMETRGSSR